MAKIKISRSANFIGFAMKFKVFLDGKLIGKVSNGKTAEFEIPAGNHELTCNQGFTTNSDKYTFSVAENETKAFNMAYSRPLLVLVSIFAFCLISFCLSRWLTLKFDLSDLYFFVMYLALLIISLFICKAIKLFYIKIESI